MAGLLEDAIVKEAPVEEAPVKEAPVKDGSLDTAKVSPDESAPVDAPAKPEWLEDKFWDAKGGANTEALAKSYADLRKEFNTKNNDKVGETIEDYATEEFMAQKGMADMKDDPAFNMALKMAQESGLGIKAAQTFIGKFMAGMGEFAPQQVDAAEELAKLGKNGPHMVSGIKSWVDGMKNQGQLNDEVHAELLKLGSSAAGIKALDVLRQKSGVINIPTGDALNGTTHMSAEDWYSATFKTHAEAGESKSAYNVRMSKLGETIFGTGHGTFTGSGLGTGRW